MVENSHLQPPVTEFELILHNGIVDELMADHGAYVKISSDGTTCLLYPNRPIIVTIRPGEAVLKLIIYNYDVNKAIKIKPWLLGTVILGNENYPNVKVFREFSICDPEAFETVKRLIKQEPLI